MSGAQAAPKDKGRYAIADPLGRTSSIPESVDDDFAYFRLADAAGIRAYYVSEGYAVVRGFIDPDACDRARAAFERKVKSPKSFIYRQASADPERNVFTGSGFILNAIVNIQSVDPKLFPGFRR
ncbi:MAG: hypothetical protein L0Y57_08120 [Beijerinckiaceae bacterium]|nr:hypothetical protein [Beijerinckiaceae bacterium]